MTARKAHPSSPPLPAAFWLAALAAGALLGGPARATAEGPSAPAAATASTAPKSPAPAPASQPSEPMERQPYRIVLHFGCHPSSRIDQSQRAALLRDWLVLVRRFVGAPWVVSIAPAEGPLLDLDLENPSPSAFTNVGAFDKVWLVHADRPELGSGLVFSGREFDTATRRLGPLQRRSVDSAGNAPRALLEFALDLFSPTAVITGQAGGRALLTIRGATIEPASPIGQVVAKGTVFQPLRLISLDKDKGQVLVKTIALTYLQVESLEGPVARCTITSAFRDPLTQRVSRPNTLAGVGIKPGKSPMRLRFVTRVDKLPAAGYTLTARLVPNGQPRELGMTDRGGRIVLPPGFADGLVVLRLLAGGVEPVVELPIMPGESAEERVVPINPVPLTVALEAQVDSLRDEVVDVVALRARLEARMEARLKGEDWAGLEEALKEFARLPPRDDYAKRLTQIKEQVVRQQADSKRTILTKTAQTQINDLQATIDRYLEDDTARAYREALDRSRSEAVAKEKIRLKTVARRPAPMPAAAAAAAPAKVAQPAPRPQPPAPARGQSVSPAGPAAPVPF